MKEISMINYKTIREQVSTYIRDQILQSKIKPGERILEQEIADELEISRGPVRESLRQLEQEGLLEYRRNRGCVVREFQKEDAAEIFFIRSALEAASVMYCEGNIPDSLLAQMEEVLNRMQDTADNGELTEFVEQDQMFHSLIVKACGLERLYALWNSLTPVSIALFMTDSRKNFVLKKQYLRHKQVLEALKSKNVDQAQKAIYAHYVKTEALFSDKE